MTGLKMPKAGAGDGLSWGRSFADLGYFPWVFGVVFGAPSIVSLVQAAFATGDLHAPIQGMIDAWNAGLRVLSAFIEPAFRLFLDWLNRLVGWRLELGPHWRHLFVLSMILVAGFARAEFRGGAASAPLVLSRLVQALPVVLIGSILAGLVPLRGSWWAEGAIAALSLATLWLGMALSFPESFAIAVESARASISAFSRRLRLPPPVSPLLVLSLALAGLASGAFIFAVALSFLPWFRPGAGIVFLGLYVIAVAFFALIHGFRIDRLFNLRLGLAILGGFLGAGLIFLADWSLRPVA